MAESPDPPKLDTTVPQTARIWNYLLGGKDNFAVDLAMYDGSDTSPEVAEAVRIWNLSANPKYHLRSPERIAALFDGLDLVEPGVVSVTRWRPEAGAAVEEIDQYCTVGRKR